jgi:hypothetical protein
MRKSFDGLRSLFVPHKFSFITSFSFIAHRTAGRDCRNRLIWFIWFVLFIWLIYFQLDLMNKINYPDLALHPLRSVTIVSLFFVPAIPVPLTHDG